MVAMCPTSRVQVVLCRRATLQHAATAAGLSHRMGSAYFGQTLRPHVAKGLQLSGSRRSRQLQPVQASFFGVGAPEAILVGVVALLVFGPKGLAQAAKSLGETLRAFQPTIRELTQVSAELKSTLENEIGINEIKEDLRRPLTATNRALEEAMATPSTSSPVQGAGLQDLADGMTAQVKDAKEGMAKLVDPDIERKREEAAKLAWGGAAAVPATAAASAQPTPAGSSSGGSSGGQLAAVTATAAPVQLESLSVEQLEAELQRRKAAAAAQVPKELRADD